MKNIHFCTEKMLETVKSAIEGSIIRTVRTGWIPQLFDGDTVNLNERIGKTDTFIRKGKILDVFPVQYEFLTVLEDELIEEEISRYGKKFHPKQYFFMIQIQMEE